METPKHPNNSSSSENEPRENNYENILRQEVSEMMEEMRHLIEKEDKLCRKIDVIEKMEDVDINRIDSPKQKLEEYIEKVESESPEISNQSVDSALKNANDEVSNFASEVIKYVKEKLGDEISIDFNEVEFSSGITPESFQKVMEDKKSILYNLRNEVREKIDKIGERVSEKDQQLNQLIKSRQDITDVGDLLDFSDGREN